MIQSALSFAVAALIAAAPAQDVSSLDWLTGAWVTETSDGWAEEHWSDARGGVMFGTGRSGSGTNLTDFEYMRIEAGGEGLRLIAQPQGGSAVVFPLSAASENHAVFENMAHDYPTRITYMREGNRLTATIAGAEGANAKSWIFCPRGVICQPLPKRGPGS